MKTKAFDLVYADEQGDLRAIEICLTGTAKLAAEAAIKGAGVKGVVEIVVACESKSYLDSVMTEVRLENRNKEWMKAAE